MIRKYQAGIIIVLLLTISFSGCFGPEEVKETTPTETGFNGVSWASVIPEKAAMLIQHDEDTYLDDYAYLAGVPASVFYDSNSDNIISYPLLFTKNPVSRAVRRLF